MARSIDTIKKEMTDAFLTDTTICAKYGNKWATDGTAVWSENFSKVSIENLIFYIVASSIYVLEVLFDKHLEEVSETISKRAHTLTWYRQKALAFQYGCDLSDDTAEYDNTGKTDEEIAKTMIVKKCSVDTAASTYPTLIVKATKENEALSAAELTSFTAYMNEIADAGVRLTIRSTQPDFLTLGITIWYDPLILNSDGTLYTDGTTKPVEEGIDAYFAELEFNGTFYPNLFEAYLTTLQGVKMAKVSSAIATPPTSSEPVTIDNYYKPYSGALEWDGDTDNFVYENFTETYSSVEE